MCIPSTHVHVQPRRFKVLFAGLPGAGKTAILDTLCNRPLEWAERTPARFNFAKLTVGGAEVEAFDPLRGCWKELEAGADGIIFVVDGSRKGMAVEERHELEGVLSSALLRGAPLLVFVSKLDLALDGSRGATCKPAADVAHALGLTAVLDRSWRVQPAATPLGRPMSFPSLRVGVDEGFDWLIEMLRGVSR